MTEPKAANADTSPIDENMDFETALKRLEDIVQTLERGEVPLERSLDLYETGTKLKAICDRKLEDARTRIETITLGKDGQPTGTRPLDGV
ncbi:MAG: exodeoxyribonuclease VII small subunit [Pacificimonas sp.]